jgi:hypothetical protein
MPPVKPSPFSPSHPDSVTATYEWSAPTASYLTAAKMIAVIRAQLTVTKGSESLVGVKQFFPFSFSDFFS